MSAKSKELILKYWVGLKYQMEFHHKSWKEALPKSLELLQINDFYSKNSSGSLERRGSENLPDPSSP